MSANPQGEAWYRRRLNWPWRPPRATDRPAIGGIEIGEMFKAKMEDPVLGRRIGRRHRIRRLPQYL